MNSKNVRNYFKLEQIARIYDFIVCNIISNKYWKLLCYFFLYFTYFVKHWGQIYLKLLIQANYNLYLLKSGV